jgi:acetyl esterase/lipase
MFACNERIFIMFRVLPLALLFALNATAADTPAPRLDKSAIKMERNITYATINGERLQLDIAYPKADGKYPLVVFIHGGAWKFGDRSELSRPIQDPEVASNGMSTIENLASRGFVGATISYRLAPKGKFHDMLSDCKTAVRFLKAKAKDYHADPDKVGAVGFSAGGHLVAMLGLAGKEAGFEGTLYPEQSSKVNCVVDLFGPTDLTLYAESEGLNKGFMRPLLGDQALQSRELHVKASPITYVKKDAPPFLIMHGTADFVVPIIHSERLVAKMKDVGAPVEFVPVKGKGHGWGGVTMKETSETAAAFLAKHLK